MLINEVFYFLLLTYFLSHSSKNTIRYYLLSIVLLAENHPPFLSDMKIYTLFIWRILCELMKGDGIFSRRISFVASKSEDMSIRELAILTLYISVAVSQRLSHFISGGRSTVLLISHERLINLYEQGLLNLWFPTLCEILIFTNIFDNFHINGKFNLPVLIKF